jgi:hypothetical protein
MEKVFAEKIGIGEQWLSLPVNPFGPSQPGYNSLNSVKLLPTCGLPSLH